MKTQVFSFSFFLQRQDSVLVGLRHGFATTRRDSTLV